MSFIGSMLSSDKGGGFSGTGANIIAPSNIQQLDQSNIDAINDVNQQQNFVNALAAQNGLANQSQVYNQLQGVANGTGPNPAQAQLAQATGQNVANQAALMAGQRGAGTNPALLARQAAMQGAGIQQNAAGQAATLQANQSLNALNQLGGIAGQQVTNQQAGLNSLNQAAQGVQQNLQSGNAAYNNANVANQSNLNNVNAGIAQGNQQGQSNLIGNIFGAAGMAAQGVKKAAGGEITEADAMMSPVDGPKSRMGMRLGGKMMAKGGSVSGEMLASKGKEVPGKAKVKGDSLKNDTVKALLSPGEIVIPRSIAQHPDAPRKAMEFVAAVKAKSGRGMR